MVRHMRHLLLVGTALSALGAAAPASAQVIDYGAYETMFNEPVTVSATGIPQRRSDVPASIDIITADEIRRSGARDVPTILDRLAGVHVQRQSSTYSQVAIRGFMESHVQSIMLLVNGRQIYIDFFGIIPWDALPVQIDEIRQIEVIKGPNTALYGFNAVSGVVNIITYNPLYDDIDQARLRVGNNAAREASLVHTQQFGDRFGVRVSGGGMGIDDDPAEYASPTLPVPGWDGRQRRVSVDALGKLTDNSHLGFEASQVNTRIRAYEGAAGPWSGNMTFRSLRSTYNIDSELGLIEASTYYNWVRSGDVFHRMGAGTHMPVENDLLVARLQDIVKVSADDTLRAAIEYRRDRLQTVPEPSGEIGYDIGAVSGMWDHAFSSELHGLAALRYDHMQLGRDGGFAVNPFAPQYTNEDFDRSISALSYNAGLTYKPSMVDTFRLNGGRGFQVPSLAALGMNLSGNILAGVPGNIASPNLKPIRVDSIETAYRREIAPIEGGAEMRLFASKTKNLLGAWQFGSPAPFPPFPPTEVHIVQQGDATSKGVELAVDGKFGDGWRWGANYTFQTIEQERLNLPGLWYAWDYEDSTPQHMVKANLGYTVGDWSFDGWGGWTSSSWGQVVNGMGTVDAVEIPDYFTARARIGYTPVEWVTLELVGDTLIPYRSYATERAEQQFFFSTVIRY